MFKQQIKELTKMIEILEANRTPYIHEKKDDKEYMKRYRKDLRELTKYKDKKIHFESKMFHEKMNKERNHWFEETRNPKIQKLADKIHKKHCKTSHTSDYTYCDYPYGNWENDVRRDMYKWYQKAEQILKDGFDYEEYENKLNEFESIQFKYGLD